LGNADAAVFVVAPGEPDEDDDGVIVVLVPPSAPADDDDGSDGNDAVSTATDTGATTPPAWVTVSPLVGGTGEDEDAEEAIASPAATCGGSTSSILAPGFN
jgi:hypothetical protein